MPDNPWIIPEFLFRGASIVLPLLMAALLLKLHGGRTAARLAALFAAGVASFAFLVTPGVLYDHHAWQLPFFMLAANSSFVLWLLARKLMDEEFRLRAWHLIPWAVLGLCGGINSIVVEPFSNETRNAIRITQIVLSAVFTALTVAQTVASWRGDLVEPRRGVRLYLVGTALAYALVIQFTVIGYRRGYPFLYPWFGTLAAALLLLLSILLIWKLLISPPSQVLEVLGPSQPDEGSTGPTDASVATAAAAAATLPAPEPRREAPPPLAGAFSVADPVSEPPDLHFLDQLNELMSIEQVYREENLTIGSLAERMKLPEHRLRRLINQGLGHRNFNAFLNTYRIEDVQRSLRDPAYDDVSILALSVDAGFQSLGPFNRAFKAATDMTPTDYRRQARQRPSRPLSSGSAGPSMLAESGPG